MKNWGTLYRYELKKIWKRKLTWVLMLSLVALMSYVALRPSAALGEEMQILREGARQIDGQVMDETFFQHMRSSLASAGEIGDHFDDSYFYLGYSDYYYPYYMAMEVGVDPKSATAKDFYTARRATVEENWASQALTAAEISYWSALEAQLPQPFTFRFTEDGLSGILIACYGLSALITIAVAVCLCGIFSEEHRARTDYLLFSSKRGIGATCLAKLLAGMTMSLTVALLSIGSLSVAYISRRGWCSFDAALQIKYPDSSLPITLGQALLIMLGLLLLYGLLSGGVAMLVSVLTKNTIAALAAPVLLCFGQIWISLPDDVQAADYLPCRLFRVQTSLRNVRLVHFGEMYFNHLQFSLLLYGLLTVLLLTLCWLGWRRSAVGKA